MEQNNQYYIVRCDRAGVFFGKIKERSETEVVMTDVRKLWCWDGAAAIEQLAVEGTKNPKACKFTVTISEMSVMNPIQIIPCSDKAAENIKAVNEWKF